jgi:hypothetical protein
LGENFEANVSLLLRFYGLCSQKFGVQSLSAILIASNPNWQLLTQEDKLVEKDERSDHEFLSDSDTELPLDADDHKKDN